jgi:hypothetical protein
LDTSNNNEKVSRRHLDANGKTERYTYLNTIAGGIRSLDHNELDANGISIQITPMDEGNVEINEPDMV